MTRRKFLAGIAGGAVLLPVAADAFQLNSWDSTKSNDFSLINEARIPSDPADAHLQEMLSGSTEPVAVRLALCFDASTTINEAEFRAQMNGAADALISEQVMQALFLGQNAPGSIAICVISYAQGAEMIMPWVDIRREEPNHVEKLGVVAEHIRSLPRPANGMTFISAGLDAVGQMFSLCMWDSSQRDVVDVFGDGVDDAGGAALRRASDRLTNAGIRVNGFAVERPDFSLSDYFNSYLITPRTVRVPERDRIVEQGFVIAASELEYNSYTGAYDNVRIQNRIDRKFRQKIKWEVAGLSPPTRFA